MPARREEVHHAREEGIIFKLLSAPAKILGTEDGWVKEIEGIVTREETGATSRIGVYAGGDAVTGAATVISAMGSGKKAAAAIDEYIKKQAEA